MILWKGAERFDGMEGRHSKVRGILEPGQIKR